MEKDTKWTIKEKVVYISINSSSEDIARARIFCELSGYRLVFVSWDMELL